MGDKDEKFKKKLAKIASRSGAAKKGTKSIDTDLKKLDKMLLQLKATTRDGKKDFEAG